MQSVQPMQWASSMRATSSGPGWPRVRSSGRMGCSSSAASAAMPSSPPGGQRLMGLRRRRWRRRRAGSRHGRAVHCVCGNSASMRSASGDRTWRFGKTKGPRGPRGLTVRLEGGGDEDSASSGPRAIAAGAALQADCRMNSAILGQIISRQRRKSRSGRSSARCSAACGRPGCSCTAIAARVWPWPEMSSSSPSMVKGRPADIGRAHQLAVDFPGAVRQLDFLEHHADRVQVELGRHVQHGVVFVVEAAVRLGVAVVAAQQVQVEVVVRLHVAVGIHGHEPGVLQETDRPCGPIPGSAAARGG